MSLPQTEIESKEALSASATESVSDESRSMQTEVNNLRASGAANDSSARNATSTATQLAPLQIVDQSKEKEAPCPDASMTPKKDAGDGVKKENTPSTDSFDNPYKHVSKAGEAMRELNALVNRKDDEKLIITNEKGAKKESTVKERREFLNQVAEKEFNAAISAADSINQSKVEATLFEVRGKLEKAADDAEKRNLQECETALESLKHSTSATRFAFAMFKAGNGQADKAMELLKQAEEKDPEAAKDANFAQFKRDLETAIAEGRKTIINKEEFMLPLITMNLGDNERQLGNKDKAEQFYRDAIKQADALDQKEVSRQLDALATERALKGNDPEALKEVEAREMAWAAVAHAPALSRINYADFLLSQGRGQEANEVLKKVQEIDPELVKDKKEFKDMLALSEKVQTAADLNPFQHLENFKKALEKKDIDKARAELQAAVKAADNLDRDLARKNKEVIKEQMMKVEADPKIREGLNQAYEIYDAFEHAAAFTRVALGRFELAAKNYNQAKELFQEAKTLDPAFVSRKEIEIDKLVEASNEPSTFQKVLEFTKNLAKELVADAAAILAGAGAVALTGWSGPGAIVAGAAAGAATYTGVKWLMGDEIHWYTPIWGAIDGATGSIAALARQALVVEGGKIVSKEIAEKAIIKTGGNVAALSGLEGLKMTEAAQSIASTGLKAMGKDIGLLTRLSSSIPFIGTGSAEYRSALAAYRALAYSNLGVHAMVNGGTAAAASALYRGTHEGVNYYEGKHETFGDFAKAYGRSVLKDTMTGVVMGGYVDGWTDGLAMSAVVNGMSTAMSKPKDTLDFLNKFGQKTSTDLAFGSVAWVVGMGGFAADRYMYRGALPIMKTSFVPSIPLWSEGYYTRESIKNVIGPALAALQKPPTAEEMEDAFRRTPGPNRVPTTVWTGI